MTAVTVAPAPPPPETSAGGGTPVKPLRLSIVEICHPLTLLHDPLVATVPFALYQPAGSIRPSQPRLDPSSPWELDWVSKATKPSTFTARAPVMSDLMRAILMSLLPSSGARNVTVPPLSPPLVPPRTSIFEPGCRSIPPVLATGSQLFASQATPIVTSPPRSSA